MQTKPEKTSRMAPRYCRVQNRSIFLPSRRSKEGIYRQRNSNQQVLCHCFCSKKVQIEVVLASPVNHVNVVAVQFDWEMRRCSLEGESRLFGRTIPLNVHRTNRSQRASSLFRSCRSRHTDVISLAGRRLVPCRSSV